LAFWSFLYYLIIRGGKNIIGNTLKMTGVYLLFAFIIPATIHQLLSIYHPTNLMTDFIDAKLDKRWELWDQAPEQRQAQLNELFPKIVDSPVSKDSTQLDRAIRESTSALENELRKPNIQAIEQENQSKNAFIKSTFWFNPVSFFQNRFNLVTQTHYDDYQAYRNEIQALVDQQIQVLVKDMWQDKKVDEQKYREYYEMLTQQE
ncbi:MAG: hypothetical protein AAFU64_17990, partial [Bacteroidota bacterium]